MSILSARTIVGLRSLALLAAASGSLLIVACSKSAPAPDAAAEEPRADLPTPASPGSAPGSAAAPVPASGATGHRLDDLSGVEIPAAPAAGTVHGTAFAVEKATFENGILEIRQGSGFFADRSIMIFTFLTDDQSPEGRSFTVKPETGFGSPHIHMSYMIEGEGVPETEMFTSDYAMRLEFGAISDGRLSGSIYLCVPDDAKSFVIGAFEAELE